MPKSLPTPHHPNQPKNLFNSRTIEHTKDWLGGTDLDLIDTADYRDIFGHIKPDPDEPNSSLTYLTGVRQ